MSDEIGKMKKKNRKILDIIFVIFISLLFKFILINLPISVTILAPIDVVVTICIFSLVTHRVKNNYGKRDKEDEE